MEVKAVKVKELISFLENFNEDTEVEVEIFDVASDKCLDSTYDIGISDESSPMSFSLAPTHAA